MKESLHTASTLASVGVLAVAGWLLKGLLDEAIDRIGHRIADWLVPLGQPSTYRLAQAALALGRLLASEWRITLLLHRLYALDPSPVPGARPVLRNFNPELRRRSLNWEDLDAAAAELEVNQRQKIPVAKPLRFVAPLLLKALRIRLANCVVRIAFVACVVVRPFAIAAGLSFRLLGWTLRIPWIVVAGLYRQLDLWAAKALFRSAIGHLPEEMTDEERAFWAKALHWDVHAFRQRRIMTARFAVSLWIWGHLQLPDRESIPAYNWGVRRRTDEQIRAEFIRAGGEVHFQALVEARPALRHPRGHRP
jgi:hypothetical protein